MKLNKFFILAALLLAGCTAEKAPQSVNLSREQLLDKINGVQVHRHADTRQPAYQLGRGLYEALVGPQARAFRRCL